jgi:hypothetical protein
MAARTAVTHRDGIASLDDALDTNEANSPASPAFSVRHAGLVWQVARRTPQVVVCQVFTAKAKMWGTSRLTHVSRAA